MKIFSALVVGLGLICCFGIGVPVSGQNIDRAEYFFNADPGIGNGNSLSLFPSSQVALNAEIDAVGLSKGFNRLYLRFGNNQGQWGFYETRLFYVDEILNIQDGEIRNIVGAEYFFDQDPGVGQGSSLPTQPDGRIIAEIPEPNLKKGFHRIFVRYRDSENRWGFSEARLFYLDLNPSINSGASESLVRAEYFFDQDPGVGNGTDLPVQSDGKIIAEITEPNLGKGFHRLFVRYQDSADRWGFSESRLFYVDELSSVIDGPSRGLMAAEYFFDLDPGVGQGTALTIQSDGKIIAEIPELNLEKGFHRLFVRYQDSDKRWGFSEARLFYLDELPAINSGPGPQITAAEYFFNQDPGVGNGTPLTVQSNGRVIAEIEMENFQLGFHRLYVRYRNEIGAWSLYETRLFYVDDNVSPLDPILVDRVEFYFDNNDPGLGNANELIFPINTLLRLEELVETAGLAVGEHTLHIRIRNTQGNWSEVEVREFTIEPADDVDPPVPTEEVLSDITALCAVTVDDLVIPTAEDVIDGTIQGVTDLNIFPITASGTTMITWTYTNSSGLQVSQIQQIVISDTEAPLLIAPNDIVIGTGENNCLAALVTLGTPQVSDNCSVASLSNNAPVNFPLGETLVTWTAVDASGNTSTAVQLVVVEDLIPPTIIAPADISITLPASSPDASSINLGSPVVSDNCAIASISNDAPTIFPIGITVVTWVVTDSFNNSASATQVVTVSVEDNLVLTAPADIHATTDEGTCSASGLNLGLPTASIDILEGQLTNDAPVIFPVGATIVTWTLVDGNGNSATATQLVTVVDTELPTIVAPLAITVSTDAGACTASAVVLGVPSTSDNCTVASISNDAPATFPVGETLVTWTVVDANGNTATATQLVTVVDTELPTIVAPLAITVSTDAGACTASAVVLGVPSTSDNCTVASISNDAPATFPVGETLVTWTVVDASGNAAAATQSVTVVDTELPTIVAPAAITVSTDAGACTASDVDLGVPSTSDNCTVASISNDAQATFPVGETLVTWTVVDANGNTATATQLVTVLDTELPTIVAPAAITIEIPIGTSDAMNVQLGEATAADNCSIASIVNDSPTIFPLGVTLVTWTVTDASGNMATAIQEVTVVVESVSAPIPDLDFLMDFMQQCSIELSDLLVPTAKDFLGQTIQGTTDTSIFPLVEPGTYAITWTFTDSEGNNSTQNQNLIIIGNAAGLGDVDCSFQIKDLFQFSEEFGRNNALGSAGLIDSQGRIYVAGSFNRKGETVVGNILRYLPDGSLDITFSASTNAQIYVMTQQADGKLLLGGSFTQVNGQPMNRFVRLLEDGAIDQTFTIGSGFDTDLVRNIAIQPDGKIILVGGFNTYKGIAVNKVLRLEPNGDLDTSFVPEIPFYGFPVGLGLQADGKIIFNARDVDDFSPTTKLIRLNPDGSIDQTLFTPVTGALWDVAVQDDGKLVLVGIQNINGTQLNGIGRLNPDGSLDETFNSGQGFGPGLIRSVYSRADRGMFVVGAFTSYQGQSAPGIVAINPDGSIDSRYDFGTGGNATGVNVQRVLQQADGNLIVIGWFNQFNGEIRTGAVRLIGELGEVPSLPSFEEIMQELQVESLSSVQWGDVDNDGDLDIIVLQQSGGKVFFNDGNGNFTEGTHRFAYPQLVRANFTLVDIDQDGDLDVFVTGNQPTGGGVNKIFLNNGSGQFMEAGSLYVENIQTASVSFGDFDNDGDLDMLVLGDLDWYDDFSDLRVAVTHIYRNDGNLVFTKLDGDELSDTGIHQLYQGTASWVDYNQDGHLDFVISGFKVVEPEPLTSSGPRTFIYKNLGNGKFEELNLNLIGVRNSSLDWADYDGDGDLDLLITGWETFTLTRIYRNEGNDSFTEINPGIDGVSSGLARWGDFDNDGDPDILVSGGNFQGFSNNTRVTKIFKNEAGSFTEVETPFLGLLGVSGGWADMDGDGDLDLLLSGWNVSNVPTLKVFKNNWVENGGISNTKPTAPSGLQAIVDLTASTVKLEWSPSSDTQTPASSLSYNLYIREQGQNTWIKAPHALLSNGWRLLPMIGNAFLSTSFTWNFRAEQLGKTFEWAVQAIDGAFVGSEFSSVGTFTLDNQPPVPDTDPLPEISAQCLVDFADLVIPTATDAIDGVVQGTTDQSLFPITEQGFYNITWTYTDASGNSSTQSQLIRVEDTEAPIALTQDLVFEIEEGETLTITAESIDAGSFDTCGPVSLSIDQSIFSAADEGENIVILTVTDAAGNVATAEAIVTIIVNRTPVCQVIVRALDVTVFLDRNGVARITSRQVNNNSYSECVGGNLTFTLSQSNFSCADLGVNEVTLTGTDRNGNVGSAVFLVDVRDQLAPTIARVPKSIKTNLQAGSGYVLPDLRLLYPAADNCTVASYTQSPAPGTVFTIAGNYPITLEARDQSNNQVTAVVKLQLQAARVRGGNNTVDNNSLISVPWNTALEELGAEIWTVEDEKGTVHEHRVFWLSEDYDPLTPGFYQVRGLLLEAMSFRVLEEPLMLVHVQDKPLPMDIGLDKSILSASLISGELIGSLYTLDPVDAIHVYEMEEHSDFYLEENQLFWKGTGMPQASYRIQVHSTDRAGQRISRTLMLNREQVPLKLLIYPNPASKEATIAIQLQEDSGVELKVFDAAGRLVYSQAREAQDIFLQEIDLKHLPAGLYQVVVKVNHHFLQGRLVKK